MGVVAGSLDRTRVGSSGSFCDELLVSGVEDSSGSEGASDLKSLPSADCSAGRLRSRGRVLRERGKRERERGEETERREREMEREIKKDEEEESKER